MDSKIYVYNIVIVALFIILAIAFNKWWLVLFSALFIMVHKEYK